jgi:hypothetical protein
MNVGSSRRVPSWAAIILAAGAACSSSCTKKAVVRHTEDTVNIHAAIQSNGHATTTADPDHLIIHGYDPVNPDSLVIWVFQHKSTKIQFKESALIPDPICVPNAHKCTLQLPAGLIPKKPYKYTITGKYDDTTDLDPNDPDIEVDR